MKRTRHHLLRSVRRIAALTMLSSAVFPLMPSGPAAHAATINTVWGTGANAFGEIGDGTTTNRSAFVSVSGLALSATAVAAGARHSLAILSDGSVVAWGRGSAGELGNGGTANHSTPVGVTGLGASSGVIAVAGGAPPITPTSPSGDGHSMALKGDGTVLGWGNNNSGEVGNGSSSTTADVLTPTAVVGLGAGSGVVAIAAGASHSLALKSDGTVLAWGNNNSGQLGNGTNVDSATPITVTGLGSGSGVIAISAGTAFSVALKNTGAVVAWGNNASGQLGDGTAPNDKTTPVAVSGIGSGSGVTAIAAGDAFAVAMKSDGTLKAWGNNASGQLGDGTAPNDKTTPVAVSGITPASGVVSISTGHSYAVARTSAGFYWAWGRNASGQLGDGTTTQRNTPVLVNTLSSLSYVGAGGAHTIAMRAQSITNAVSVGDASVMEGNTGTIKVTFPVTLSQPGNATVTVHYAVADNGSGSGFAQGGTTAAGHDYKTLAGTVTFAVGGSGKTPVAKTVSVTVYSDATSEPDEQFGVTLSAPTGGFSLGRAAATGTIVNDDPPPSGATITMGIGPLQSIVEGDSGTSRKLVFPVTLSAKASSTVTVHYALTPLSASYGATAGGGSDYGGATSGTISFAAGSTSKSIKVTIWADIGPESDELFAVNLSNLAGLPSNALVSSSAYGVILNDDGS